MFIGPHIKKEVTPNATRDKARREGWGCFQTHWQSPRTLRLKEVLVLEDNTPKEDDPIWVIHSAYPASVTPRPEISRPTYNYIVNLTKQAALIGAQYVVIHVGGTKDKEVSQVEFTIRNFLTTYKISEWLDQLPRSVTLLIENVAAAYPFNQSLKPLIGIVKDYDHVGWCLDLHHSWAAGIPYSEIQALAVEDLPDVVHANFPGSEFGSGRDRHGWRSQWRMKPFTTAEQTSEWDTTLKILNEKEIPLILEGSKYPESNLVEELDYIQNHVLK